MYARDTVSLSNCEKLCVRHTGFSSYTSTVRGGGTGGGGRDRGFVSSRLWRLWVLVAREALLYREEVLGADRVVDTISLEYHS